MKKSQIILLVLILLLGIGLRSVEVLNKNFVFSVDQGRDYLVIEKMVTNKRPTLIGPEVGAGFAGFSGIFQGPYYFYSLVIPYLLFKGDPYGGLVLMFLFGIASLFLSFFIVKKILGIKAALITTFLLAVSHLISAQSRLIWNPHPSTFFILLAFWFTYLIPKNPKKYFFLATFFGGLVCGFQIAISIPLILTQFLYLFLVLKLRDWRVFLAGVLGVILAYLPSFAFEVRHGLMAMRSFLGIFFSLVTKGQQVDTSRLFVNHLLDFWNSFVNTFVLGGPWPFLLLLTMLVITHELIKKRGELKLKESFLRFLFLLPLVTFVVFLFIVKTIVWDYYLTHLQLAYIFIFSFYLTQLKWPKVKVILVIFLLLMIPGVVREIKRACRDYTDLGGTAKIKGKIEALDYIYQDAGGQEFNLLVFTPPVYDHAYRYLLNWYGARKYGYLPGEEKKDIFYLLIEPEPNESWHQGWLETVIGPVGEVIKEEKLPNGFIIQKRYAEKD